MNTFYRLNIEDNKKRLSKTAIGSIKNAFERALIWQDEKLDEYSDLPLSYEAQQKSDHVVDIFLAFCFQSESAISEILDHGLDKTGHDLALQMLGHGVGFWEQDKTKELNEILDYLLDSKVIKPFIFYTSESTLNIDGKQVLDWDIA